MYEDRGENLSFLHKYDPACSTTPIDSWGHPVKDPEEMSGSERLRKQIKLKRKNREAKEPRAARPKPTKADLGEVKPPVVMPVENPKDHMRNAFLEFAALTIAIQDVTQTMCKNILNIYKKGDIEQLKRKLEENEGTIYNNKSSQYILGDARQNMAAYNDTCGLVYLDEQATKITGKAKYETQKTINSGNDQRHKGSLGRKNPENDEKLSKENDQDYSETFTDWKHRKLHGSTEYLDVGKQRGSFKNLTIKGIA
ncbi:hypothetical protein EVAR_84178_1 [Eumeta japonica]|uniref:Uncharacterized protein n=1 Tax=Eumeta variegata TaxID=151549 RepID=A0A4C1ZTJ0_EUMVA|nr:hypothetical protein EVAR_84178_1 [Eumeta japonica]